MSATVKQENRWRKTLQGMSDAADARKREIEAAFMPRLARSAAVLPPPSASRQSVRRWMRNNAADYEEATHLAEAANAALDLPHGAMDDETHWVWEEALSAIERCAA